MKTQINIICALLLFALFGCDYINGPTKIVNGRYIPTPQESHQKRDIAIGSIDSATILVENCFGKDEAIKAANIKIDSMMKIYNECLNRMNSIDSEEVTKYRIEKLNLLIDS